MAKLYSAQQYIKSLTAFKNQFTKLKPSDDLERAKLRFVDSIDTMRFYLKDLSISLSRPDSRRYLTTHDSTLATLRNTIESAPDISMITAFAPLVEALETEELNDLYEYALNISHDDLNYSENTVFNLDESFLQELRKKIVNTKLNIFFPNCGEGCNGKYFGNENDVTYGNSNNNIRTARESMDRVLHGPLKGSTISNNFFDVVFVNPKIGYGEAKDYMGVVMEPCERIEIKNCIKYLRPNGLMMITLPATRITPALALYLSKVLTNVNVFKVPIGYCSYNPERVTIMGIKKATNTTTSDETIYKRLKCFDFNTAYEIDHTIEQYALPTEELILELFRGSKLDLADIKAAMSDSIIDNFLINQTQPLVIKDQSPLQPFNIGQVGLVLTSGCLDGVVEEMDGVHHVIKGMTTKVTTTVQEDLEDNKIRSTETISNQVKINVFTADGEFIQLG